MINIAKELWKRLTYSGQFALAYFLIALPPQAFWGLVRIVGFLNYHLNRNQRQAALAGLNYTLSHHYTAAELRAICRKLFLVRSAKYVNFLAYPAISTKWMTSNLQVHGLDTVREILKNKKGIIFPSMHTGDMNLFVPLLSSVCCTHVIRLGRVAWVQRVTSGRVFGTHDPIRDLYRALIRGESLALAIDGIAGKKLVPVIFLGHQIFVQPTLARLVGKTNCTIIPLVSILGADNRYDMTFLKPISYEEDLDYPDFAQRIMQKLFDAFAPYVLRDPAQWHMWPFLDIMRLPLEERPEELVTRT